METFVIQFIHGLVYGLLLFLVASGLTLVFGMMSVLNIAHVSFYMLGAYLSYTMFKCDGQLLASADDLPDPRCFLGNSDGTFYSASGSCGRARTGVCHHLWHPFRTQ